jgi:putative intracellular protease/amidase
MEPRILIVLTSHSVLGTTGKPTGAYLSEVAHPWAELTGAGFAVDFASVKGGEVPLDGVDRKDPINAALLDDKATMARIHASLAPAELDPTRYAAIFYAGGHGTMWDFPGEATLARVAAAIYERGGVVAAVCHGPSALTEIRLSNGSFLVAGKAVAAFTNEEEEAIGLTKIVPFLLADRLVERGAIHEPAAKWAKQVVVSERLVTGQNPQSAAGVGKAMVALLRAAERTI